MLINEETTSSPPRIQSRSITCLSDDLIHEIFIKLISRSHCRFCEVINVVDVIIAAGLDRTLFGILPSPLLLKLPPPVNRPSCLEFICQIDHNVCVKSMPLDLGAFDRCVGSSQGFLVFVNSSLQFLLLNPVNNYVVSLPSLSVDGALPEDKIEVRKIILSKTSSSRYAVALFKSNILVLKVDSDSWTRIDSEEAILDFTSEGQKLFLLTESLSIEVWDVEMLIRIKEIAIHGFFPELQNGRVWSPDNREGWINLEEEKFHLHKEEDKFKLIVRLYGMGLHPHQQNHDSVMQTMNFKLFGINEEKKWVEEASMDQIIFLGINETVVLQKNDYPVLRNKSIYFVEDLETKGQWGAGTYSWDDDGTTLIPVPNIRDNSVLVWFFPSFFQED